jgi:cytochrome c-type protein NapC
MTSKAESIAGNARPGAVAQIWSALRRPSAKYSILALLTVGFFSGIVFWGGFNTAMEATNTLEFCVSCHEMRDTVYQEYQKTIHFSNRTGVRAVCSDCHVPKDWVHKMARKIQASSELYHKVLGSIDTPEKFEAKRLRLAQNEWARMKASDSRECRNCHSFEGMNTDSQKDRAKKMHESARRNNETCIDCHKGIAHKPVHKQLESDDDEI